MLLALLFLSWYLWIAVAQCVTDGDESRREVSQQDLLPGKAGTLHTTSVLRESSSVSAALQLSQI